MSSWCGAERPRGAGQAGGQGQRLQGSRQEETGEGEWGWAQVFSSSPEGLAETY